jgi:hypothetical protein
VDTHPGWLFKEYRADVSPADEAQLDRASSKRQHFCLRTVLEMTDIQQIAALPQLECFGVTNFLQGVPGAAPAHRPGCADAERRRP